MAGSSAEYGLVRPEEVPVREDHSLLPLHPYGISKVAQDLLAYQYWVNFGIHSLRMRIFNTTGPGKIGDLCADVIQRVIGLSHTATSPVLKVGNLEPRRDLSDVRDAVAGLCLAMEHGKPGEVYNLCRGEAYRVGDIVEKILRLTKLKAKIEVDPALLRPSDEPVILGDNSRLRGETGWKPAIPLEKTLADMLEYSKGVTADESSSTA